MKCPTCNEDLYKNICDNSNSLGMFHYINDKVVIQRSYDDYCMYYYYGSPLLLFFKLPNKKYVRFNLNSKLSDNIFHLPNEEFKSFVQKMLILL